MKKIIFLVLLVVLILGITACDNKTTYNNIQNENNKEGQANVQENLKDNEEEGLIKSSLSKLMDLGKSVKCEFEYVDEEGTVTQTTYVSGEKFNSESFMTIQGETMNVYSISDGTWLYMWSDMTPGEGTKIKFEDFAEDAQEAGQGEYESTNLNLDEEYDFKCVPWVANNAKFVPPSNVNFRDLGAMMDEMQEAVDNLNNGEAGDMCAMCDMIPDAAAKADCLASC